MNIKCWVARGVIYEYVKVPYWVNVMDIKPVIDETSPEERKKWEAEGYMMRRFKTLRPTIHQPENSEEEGTIIKTRWSGSLRPSRMLYKVRIESTGRTEWVRGNKLRQRAASA